MGYFQNFPQTLYRLDQKDIRAVTDIIRRTVFRSGSLITANVFYDYIWQDGDRPDIIANKAYGNPDLYWIILLFNRVVNPLYHFPMNQNDLDNYIKNQYPGKAVFIDAFSAKPIQDANGNTTPSFVEAYSVGNAVSQTNGLTGSIISIDPSLFKIVIDTQDIVSDDLPLVVEGPNGIQSISIARSNISDEFSVRYFEDISTGKRLSHLGSTSAGPQANTSENLIRSYLNGGLVEDQFVVTNRDYEIERNERNRTVKILRTEYVEQVVNEFSRKMSNA